MDIPSGERINVTRIKEARKTNADIVAVGCVFCLQMLNDAAKILNLDESLETVDISELVVKSMGGQVEIKALAAEREKEAA